MKYILALLMILVSGSGCAHPPPYERADKASLRLERPLPNGRVAICSAWVYWDHAIVTDEHCIADGVDGWKADGRAMRVKKVILDGNDHAILITDLFFRYRARLGQKPRRGDEVFTLGNPDSISDILLVSRVAGFKDKYVVPGYGTFSDLILLDSNDWYGCSGAAIFDRYGRVVGMVNAVYPFPQDGWRLTAGFGLKFTKAQWREARGFKH